MSREVAMSAPFRLSLLAVLLVLVGMSPSAWSGPGVWTSAGPESGNVVEIAVSASSPSTIFINGDYNAIYRSTDTGLTWTRLTVAPHVGRFLALRTSPHDGDTLMVSSHLRLYRTTDGGDSWTAVAGGLPVPAAIDDVVFDPHVAGRAWLVDASGLYVSSDDGAGWSPQATSGLAGRLLRLSADPHVPGRLFGVTGDEIAGTAALYRSTDAGATWSAVSGLGSAYLWPSTSELPIAYTPTPGTIVLAADYTGIFRSVDGGASFASVGHVDLPNARMANVLRAHPTDASTLFVGMDTGLARTTDGGATWAPIGAGIQPVAGGYSNGIDALYVHPSAPDTLYAGALYTGFFVTTDGGASWMRRNGGLHQAAIRALAVHPTQPLWVYAGYGDAFDTPSDGLFRSVDRGGSWFTASPTLQASGLRAFAIDPKTTATPFSTTMYAAGYGAPLFSLDGSIRDGNAGVFKSTDGGATWTTIDNGIPFRTDGGYRRSWFNIARSVVLDPSSGSGPGGTGPLQTLYLGGSGSIQYDGTTGAPTIRAARIYKSTDAGATWSPSDAGLPVPMYDVSIHYAHAVQVVPLAIDPLDPDTLYAGTYVTLPGSGGDIPEPLVSRGVNNGVFKSTDGGASWSHSSSGLPRLAPGDPDSPHRNVLALAVASDDPSILYAATGRDFYDSVVYRSSDGGASWTEANAGIAPDADIRVLLVDPDDADIAYAGATGSDSNPGGVYRTIDGGATWTSYSVGLPSSAAIALELEKSGAVDRLYAGTRNGVFSIDQVPDEDTDGVPTTIESEAPAGGDGNGDGVPDTVQPHVASMPAAGEVVRGGAGYVSVELVPLEGSCSQLQNTHALPDSAFPPDPGREALHGFVRLDVGECTQAQLRFTLHGASVGHDWAFRIYAPTTPADVHTYAWRDFPAVRTGDTWTVTLTDNALGDLRDGADAILFQGGVVRSEAIFANGFDAQ
jgi:photosystem II stability/assembly factor-like uncharacterized protein